MTSFEQVPVDKAIGPGEGFVDQVRDVLVHLYNYPYLQTHPLIEPLVPESQLSPRARMRALRSLILEAVEELNPGLGEPSRSLWARSYNLLHLHYVEGLMMQEVAQELSLSERQAYRDLRKAERDLADLLWPRCQKDPKPEADQPRVEAILLEAERQSGGGEDVEVQALLQGAFQAVARLADDRGVQLSLTTPPVPFTIRTHRMLSRQALVSVLSHAIRQACPGSHVTLSAEWKRRRAQVLVSYHSTPDARRPWEEDLAIPRRMVERQRGEWKASSESDGRWLIAFTLGGDAQATVLVIDDNEELIELFQRYLTGEDYQLIGATSATEGLRLVEKQLPDIIVLDVMMPRQDGWEMLQLLKNRKQTVSIPIIICSVINDPELSFSLGAAGVLPKPVQREELLKALERCRRQ